MGSKRYSGIVQVKNFFTKKKGGFYAIGERFYSTSKEAIDKYKSIKKLK